VATWVKYGSRRRPARRSTSRSRSAFQRDLDARARRGLDRAANVAEARIREHMTRVSRAPGAREGRHTRDSIFRVKGVGRTRRGYVVSIVSPQPNALWQERGTHAHKGRPKRASTAAKRSRGRDRVRREAAPHLPEGTRRGVPDGHRDDAEVVLVSDDDSTFGSRSATRRDGARTRLRRRQDRRAAPRRLGRLHLAGLAVGRRGRRELRRVPPHRARHRRVRSARDGDGSAGSGRPRDDRAVGRDHGRDGRLDVARRRTSPFTGPSTTSRRTPSTSWSRRTSRTRTTRRRPPAPSARSPIDRAMKADRLQARRRRERRLRRDSRGRRAGLRRGRGSRRTTRTSRPLSTRTRRSRA
jgi:hypothetical protein